LGSIFSEQEILTQRINTRPMATGRRFHCGCASIKSAPFCAGALKVLAGRHCWAYIEIPANETKEMRHG
jgi:hypothetical protein